MDDNEAKVWALLDQCAEAEPGIVNRLAKVRAVEDAAERHTLALGLLHSIWASLE